MGQAIVRITNWELSTVNREGIKPQCRDRIELVELKPGVFTKNTGWTWTLRFFVGDDKVFSDLVYRTNHNWEGLYAKDRGNGWNQILGNGQFSLPRTRRAAIKAIVRHWRDEYSEVVYGD